MAAEHFAFSTDTILAGLIGFKPHPLGAYAKQLRNERCWSFWWE